MLKPIAYVRATFPRTNYSSNPGNCPITYIQIGCKDIMCYFELGDDYVSILEGGIGKPNVLLRISSLNRYIYFYRIGIYVKCWIWLFSSRPKQCNKTPFSFFFSLFIAKDRILLIWECWCYFLELVCHFLFST